MSYILTDDEIRGLLKVTPPLVTGMPNADEQIQPNGIDLTVKEIASLSSLGSIGLENMDRVLSSKSPLVFDDSGATYLPAGCYLVTYNEVVHLPKNIMALGFPRSSLLRCGVSAHTAVWDAGYSGRSESLLVVYNINGFRLYSNARIVQLVFFHLGQVVNQGYQGVFQGENI